MNLASSSIEPVAEVESTPEAVAQSRSGGGFVLLTLLFVAVAGYGLWWAQQASLSPSDDGFEPIDSAWARFIGRFHPLIVHLPIGILSLAGLLEGLRLLSRKPERLAPAMTVVMWAAALSCLTAITVGYLLVLDGGPGSNARLLEQHIHFVLLFCAAVLAALFLWHLCRWLDTWLFRWLFRVSLVAAFAMMGAGSHYGGAMVHGPTYLTRHMPEEIKPIAIKLGLIDAPEAPKIIETDTDPPVVPPIDPIEVHGPVNGETDTGTPDATTVMVYRDLVDPLFEMKCMECHEEGNIKGRFRMDTYADLMKGGSLGPSIVAGNAEESELVFRLLLPLDDDERMPPPKKEQLTEAEIALVQWWIDRGAAEDLAVSLDELPESFRSLVGSSESTGLSSLR